MAAPAREIGVCSCCWYDELLSAYILSLALDYRSASDAKTVVTPCYPNRPLAFSALRQTDLDLLVDVDGRQVAIFKVAHSQAVFGEHRKHHDQQQRPVNKNIAVAFNLAAVLAIEMDLVGVESKRGEAEELSGAESERMRG